MAMNKEDFQRLLEEEQRSLVPDISDFEGNTWDFLGQALWGFTEQATFGALSVSDAVAEAKRGDAAYTWEEAITGLAGGRAGSWDELTDTGKAGYALGAAFGQIPSFWAGGILTSTALKSAAKIGTYGTRMAVKKSTKELIDAGKNIAVKKGVDVSKALAGEVVEGGQKMGVATKIIDDAYEFAAGANTIRAIEGNMASELYEKTMVNGLRTNIAKVLNISDNQMLDDVAKSTFDIITKNNPDDALSLLQMTASRLPGLRERPGAALVLGSMGYDASIGVILGTMRAGVSEMQAAMWNVKPNEYGEMKRNPGLYEFNAADFAGRWLTQAATEAAFFAPLGAVKFVKGFGGTSASHLKRASNMIKQTAKMWWKPLKKYTNVQLRSQLTAMDDIAGGYLNIGRGPKFEKLGKQWWLEGGTAESNTKLMREYLGQLRKEYLLKAPYEWTKEFGKDVLASLPRMGAGVMAMHGPHVISSFWNHGFSRESLATAMGGSMPEIASNIFTAMYFTRKPHSFNVEATPGMFGRMFQTGKIPAYFNAKQSKLRKMVGNLNTFGVNDANMSRVLTTYGHKSLDDFKHEQSDTIIKRAIDDSPELNEIKTILSPHIGKEVVDGADLRTAFNKHISDIIKSGEITYDESLALKLHDKLFIAQKIIDIHNQNSPEKLNVDSMRPQDAYDIVTKLSEITFNGETLSKYNPDEQITSWVEKTISDAVKQPQEVLKTYILDTYKALGIPIEANEFGIIKGPRLDKVDFGDSFMNNIFRTVFDFGVKNNWIDPLKGLPEPMAKISGEVQTKAIDVHNAANKKMMGHVYGEGWEARAIEFDPLILQNDAWHITYNDYLKVEQRRNAYEILTGGKDHNTTALEATDIRKAIEDLILSRSKPEVTKDDGAVSDYGEVSLFIDNLHEIAVGLEPSVARRVPKTLTQEQAASLMEKTKSLVGDLFTNTESLKDFKQYVFNKSIQKLGLNDISTGIDTKASIISLRNDIGFNYQDTGPKLIFPDRMRIASKLQTAYEDGKIPRESYDQLLKHYDNVFNAIDNSGFPVEFRRDVLEQNTGDWIKALTKSMSDSANAIDIFSNDKARQAASFLENKIDQLNMQHEHIKLGADNIDPELRKQAAKDIQSMGGLLKVTNNLTELIKTALIERNTAVLDAAARKEGDIHKVMDILSRDPLNSDKSKYMQEILEIQMSIEKEAQSRILNEDSIRDLIRRQLSEFKVPDKDLRDNHMRITSSQFQVKYGISNNYLDKLFDIDRSARKNKQEIKEFAESILGEFYNNPENLPNLELRENLVRMTRTIKNLAEDIPMNDHNFQRLIVEPLRLAVRVNMENIPVNKRPSREVLDSDIYSITSSYFSKIPIKTLKVDLSSNKLIQNYKVMGDVGDRGLMGIINHLDSGQNHIYVVENAGIDHAGRPIRDINGFDLGNINAALNSGNFTIRSPKGKADYYKHGDATTLKDVNTRAPDIGGARYKIVPINETTSLIVRTDARSIRERIQEQFSTDGELYKKLEAIFDGDLSGDAKRSVRDLLENIRNATTDDSIVEAVKLTRLILDLPHAIDKVIDNGSISLDHDFIKDSFKRAKLVEPKNGFIPTDKNISRAASMYRNAESEFHRNVHERLSEWYTPDSDGNYRRLRTLSINDEAAIVDASGNKLNNIFSSLDRVRESLREQLELKEIDQETHDYNIKLADEASKSIVDGEMFLSRDAYLFAMSLIGIHPDMVRIDLNGDITGFKSGGIKPTVTYSDIVFDRAATDYGKVQTWFGKTAFKYNPLLDNLMQNLGVDALTFKSGNKINTLKERAGREYNDQYAEMIGIGAAETETLSRPWHEYLSVDKIVGDHNNSIIELPWESMSLRTISSQHDPLVGANTGVHFSDNNGIADWIGVDGKIQAYNDNLANMYTNPFYRTALARKVLGSQAETGDPSMMNTAVSSILAREGVIMEPWAQRRLEDSMISYFINNGNIAGGVVPDGSLDVMTADMGNLGVTIRSNIGPRPTVQFFGEFLPSYYASQKIFKKSANQINDVGNVLIQRVNYTAENNNFRVADAFVIEIGGEKFLQIEGRAINKKGDIIELDNFDLVKESNARNRQVFNDAVALDTRGMDMMVDGTNLARAALLLDNANLGLSVGTLNSRQPRNMIGDIVISKIGIVEGADGVRRAHVDESAGNVSRMNHIDAIKPQDADFDFDKSFNYVAAPGLFWREANRAAGYITQETVEGSLNKLFDPNLESWRYSKTIPNLVKGGTRNDQVMHEVNAARGRFIKMHQTATYLSNIFRRYPGVLKFTADFIEGPNKTINVRINHRGKYADTVNNISRMAKEYIDVYKNLPSDKSVQQINDIQNEIFFGRNGLFEVFTVEGRTMKENIRSNIDLNSPDYFHVRTAIRKRIIDPLNVYLKYNKGVYEDPSGIQSKATLKNYNDAYIKMVNGFDKSNLAHIDPRINMEQGLQASIDYFSRSKNAYDVAMIGLHEVYQRTSNLKQEGQYGKGVSESKDIVDYIEGGYEALSGESQTAKHNRIFNNALREYVADEARALKLHDLARQETHLKLEIENKEAYIKGDVNDNLAVKKLREQLSRVQEVKRTMEEAISYKFGDFDDNPVLKYNTGFSIGKLSPLNKPYVVIDSKGKIKEVILKGRYNQNPIYKSDKIVENGKRFEVTNGDEQKGLRVLFQAFSGIPKIVNADGSITRIHKGELSNIIRDYKMLQRDIILLEVGVGREGRAEYALEAERIIYDALFNHPSTKANEAYRKALIMQMLTPSISDKVVSIRSINNNMGKQAVYDYIYQQNSLSEKVMSLLSKIESGEHKGDVNFAKSVLDDINTLKLVSLLNSENPNIDFKLVKTRMFTEPASLDGFMTQDKYLNQDIYAKTRVSDDITRTAAEVMVKYANSGDLVDPVILYQASREMSKNGIDYAEQWANKVYVAEQDGTTREFGLKRHLISEHDSIHRKDLGERGGQGESTTRRVKDIFDCLDIK